jgi:hypothetical protein
MTEKRFLWHVEAVLPPDDNRKWAKNLNVQVFVPTLEQAIEAVRERYPQVTFIKVLRERWVDEVLINPSVPGNGASQEDR